jgi:AcrR family transcriptional regulator
MPTEPVPASPAGDPAPDRRSQGRERRRNDVFSAAVSLFTEQGFENTTMDQIAERADVARATVFNHFPRKTAFLDEWSARRRQRALAAADAGRRDDHSTAELVERYMRELARLSDETRAETVALMGAAVHSTNVLAGPPLAQALGAMLAAGQRDGDVRADADAELAGLLLTAGYFAILASWITTEPAPFPLERQLVRMASIVLAGVQPAEHPGDRPGGRGRAGNG